MPFLGVQPTDTFASVAKQTLTGDLLGTTSFTLDHGVSSANDIALFINNVRQEPVTAYTASGNTLTLTESINAADDAYLIYIARTFQSLSIKGITDDTEDAIMTIDGSLTTGGDVVLKVGQNQENGYYVQDKDFGFEISNGGVGGNTVQIKNNGQTILSHNQIQDNLRLRTDSTDRVTILSGGNVGIGDTTPSALLSIRNGSAEGTVAEFYGSTDGKTRALSITSGTVNNFSGAEWTLGIGSSGGEFVFENNTHATPSELVRITNGGQLNAYGFKQTGTNNPYPIKVESETFVYYPHYNTAHVAYYKQAVHPSNSNEYHYYWRTSDTGTAGGANETTWMTLNTGATHGGKLHLTGGVSFASNFASAHTLDDYEEGTWTPTVWAQNGTTVLTSGVDYQVQTAAYTKVGNLVHVIYRIRDLRTTKDSLMSTIPFASAYSDYSVGIAIPYTTGYGAAEIFMMSTGTKVMFRHNLASQQYKYGTFTYLTAS